VRISLLPFQISKEHARERVLRLHGIAGSSRTGT
jgi:hypothetical protein